LFRVFNCFYQLLKLSTKPSVITLRAFLFVTGMAAPA
jgi:hypothetical protein